MAEAPAFIQVKKIINQIEIKPGETVADFGAGHGFFTIEFGKRVGPSGQVYAIDVLQTALEAIRSLAKLEGLFNVKLIRGNLEKPNGSTLPNGSCDMVMVANVLFQVPDKSGLVDEAKRVLKPGGRLVIVEWKPFIEIGPKKEGRVTEIELKQLISSKGFSELQTLDAGSHHYGIVFIKS